jgi:hypothetical protein
MSELPLPPSGSASTTESQALADRILARVNEVTQASDRRTYASRQAKEARALRRVFSDLGIAYRAYRHRTGQPVSPVVREAAIRFRKELNLTSLVSVAASLDDIEKVT